MNLLNKKLLSALSIFMIITSCNYNQNEGCSIDYSVIYTKESDKFIIIKNDFSKNFLLHDKGIDSGSIGGEYLFTRNNKLKEYKFFVSKNNYTYYEAFNENGSLFKCLGSPLVLTNLEEIDANFIQLHFFVSSLRKNILSLEAKLNNGEWKLLGKMTSDSLFSNMKHYQLIVNAQGVSTIKIATRVNYKYCNEQLVRTSIDSSYFERK